MLSKKTFKLLKIFYALVSISLSLPFKYSPETKTLSVKKKHGRNIMYYLVVLWSGVEMFYLPYNFVCGLLVDEIDMTVTLLDLLFTLMVSCVFAPIILLSVYWKETFVNFFNLLVTFDQNLTKKMEEEEKLAGIIEGNNSEEEELQIASSNPAKNVKEIPDGCEKILDFFNQGLFGLPLVTGIVCYVQSSSPRYMIHGILKMEGFNYSWISIARAVWEGYMRFAGHALMTVYFDTYLMYVNCTSRWLTAVKISTTTGNMSRSHKELDLPFKIYKQLQILNWNFNENFQTTFTLIVKGINVAYHSFILYTLVVHHNTLPIPVLMVFFNMNCIWLTMEFVTYPLAGQVYETSVDYIRQCQLHYIHCPPSFRPVLMRTWRSINRPLGVRVWNFYVIKKSTPLVLLAIVFNTTINAILV